MYSDDDLLMLSGIQHIAFCERQWALIYIEQQWVENTLTIQGHHLHERVDNPFESEVRAELISLRGVYIVSYSLGLYGKADLVELTLTAEAEGSITLPGSNAYWKVRPVEYKRGKPKPDLCDEVQLCAQAICLEEMYNVRINNADIFYGEPRRRKFISLDDNLRNLTKEYAFRMHQLFLNSITPPPEYLPKCRNCSLLNICQPDVISKKKNVKQYFEERLNLN